MIDKEITHKLTFGGCIAILFLVGFSMSNLMVNINISLPFAILISLILIIFGIVAYLIVLTPDSDNNEYELYDSDAEILFED